MSNDQQFPSIKQFYKEIAADIIFATGGLFIQLAVWIDPSPVRNRMKVDEYLGGFQAKTKLDLTIPPQGGSGVNKSI